MSRPKPTVILQSSNKTTFKLDEVLAAEGIWAVFYDGKPINLKSSSLVANYPGPKYKKVSFSNPGHAENYESRSLRLTKSGFQTIEELDLKTYTIKFPQKIIFTPQTYLWLDEFVDCPYFVDKAKIIVTMEKMALQLMLFAGDVTKYGLARAMSKAEDQENH